MEKLPRKGLLGKAEQQFGFLGADQLHTFCFELPEAIGLHLSLSWGEFRAGEQALGIT